MSVRINLHNHTRHSDGAGRAEDLIQEALRSGLTHLGISDHLQSTKLPASKALSIEQVPSYIEELRSLRVRYQDEIKLLAGIEINFSLLQTDFTFLSRYEPQQNPLNSLDFVLFEYVNDTEWYGLGLEELLKIRPLFQIPVGLAHNDLAKNFAGVAHPESLAKILAQAQIFVELCPTRRNSRREAGKDFVPYYRVDNEFNRRFYEAARAEQVMLSIGCDVHADYNDIGAVDDAGDFLAELDLERQVISSCLWSGAP